MSPSSRPRRRGLLPYAWCLGVAASAYGADPDATPAEPPSKWENLEGNAHLQWPNTIFYDHGLVAKRGSLLLIADSARISIFSPDAIWASGHVVMVQPGIRIEAPQLGYRYDPKTKLGSGEAWDVDVVIESVNRTIRAHAKHLTIEPRLITLSEVRADFGYGGILSVNAPTIRIYLPEHRNSSKLSQLEQIRKNVDAVALVNPTVRVLGVPCLYLPYLYRNFTWDEPWSRFEFGEAKRLGTYLHWWLGSNLPAIAGWQTRIETRVDDNSRAGWGFGATASWRNDDYGHGQVELFEMPKETVAGGLNDDDDVGVRKSRMVDAEHQLDFGHGMLYARYVDEPAPDPGTPLEIPPLGASNERFRADYFADDLNHRPFAEKGAGLAYGFTWGTLTVDDWHNPRPEWDQTERWLGLHAESAPLQLFGPVHAQVTAWEEDLHRVPDATSAERFWGDVGVGGLQWLGGVGVDATAGVRQLRYDNGRIFDQVQGDSERRIGYFTGGLRLNLEDATTGWLHIFTPRIGIDTTSRGFGGFLPGYGFGDIRDTLAEDQRYYTLGFDTSITEGVRQLRATVTSRFAMRDQDRIFIDPVTGFTSKGATRFADVTFDVEGQLTRVLGITATGTYDDRPQRFTDLNAAASLTLSPHIILHHSVALVTSQVGQPVAPPNLLSNSPGVTYIAQRYRLDASATLIPGGRAIDTYSLQLGREMVDGELTLSYEIDYNTLGELYDQRFSIGFSLFATHAQQPGVLGRGATYTSH
jgi:hypothetical protein